jgi:hypothetical protein
VVVLHIGRSGNTLVGETCTSFVILYDLCDGRFGPQHRIFLESDHYLDIQSIPNRDAAKR